MRWSSQVIIKPLENCRGRVVEVIENERGRQFSVRYFNNGEAKQSLFFEDEIVEVRE